MRPAPTPSFSPCLVFRQKGDPPILTPTTNPYDVERQPRRRHSVLAERVQQRRSPACVGTCPASSIDASCCSWCQGMQPIAIWYLAVLRRRARHAAPTSPIGLLGCGRRSKAFCTHNTRISPTSSDHGEERDHCGARQERSAPLQGSVESGRRVMRDGRRGGRRGGTKVARPGLGTRGGRHHPCTPAPPRRSATLRAPACTDATSTRRLGLVCTAAALPPPPPPPSADPRKSETAEWVQWVRILEAAGIKVQVWNPSGDERDHTGVVLENVEVCFICERPPQLPLPAPPCPAGCAARASLLSAPRPTHTHWPAAVQREMQAGRAAAAADSAAAGRRQPTCPCPAPPPQRARASTSRSA